MIISPFAKPQPRRSNNNIKTEEDATKQKLDGDEQLVSIARGTEGWGERGRGEKGEGIVESERK